MVGAIDPQKTLAFIGGCKEFLHVPEWNNSTTIAERRLVQK
jgi:hypothetical protein